MYSWWVSRVVNPATCSVTFFAIRGGISASDAAPSSGWFPLFTPSCATYERG